MTPSKPENSPLSDYAWERFVLLGTNMGLGWDHEDDWKPWYDTFKQGYVAGQRDGVNWAPDEHIGVTKVE